MKKYASLYMQTEYSLLSSMLSLDKLKSLLDVCGYEACAITDNAMHGAYKFYNLCKSLNVKPIIGLRLGLYNQNFDNMVLLYAKNMDGYKSLMRISSKNEIKKEELTKEFLQLNNKGILAIIPIFENEMYVYYQNRETKALEDTILEYKTMFEDVYFGISLQGNRNLNDINYFIDLGTNYDIKSVCINRSAYVNDSDINAFAILKMIALNIKASDNNGSYLDVLTKEEKELKLLSSLELEKKFENYLNLLYTTQEVANKCNLELNYSGYYFPKAILENKKLGLNSKEYLFNLAKIGLQKRLNQYVNRYPNYLNKEKIEKYKERLIYELGIINKMGFNDYFLIVYDYVKYAKTHDIMVGPGRGSAGGSLVSYSLGITDVDPIYFNLLFERFLNPERVGMPDIDVDFEDEKRDKLIAHLGEKYGKNKVAHIVTFGTYKAKLAIRDVSRILCLSELKLKEIMKYISANLSIDDSINNSPILQNMISSDEEIENVIINAKKIEGLPKNYSTHAAGIIMADNDLCDYTPLQEGIDGLYQTQYEASDLESIGLVKMDVLGLMNLSIIKNTLKFIKKKEHIDVDLKEIPLDDKMTYNELAKGNTLGIFQLESSGVVNVLCNLKTSSLEDIIAATALFRPGPMEMIPSFIRRKFGYEKVTYLDKSMEEVLKPTYGIIVYQEQIMLIAAKYAGYSLGEADILRRAISKKKAKVIEEERKKFVLSACANGKDEAGANKVYDYIEKFASYGFNRSHAVAYALIAYQMSYLKTHYYKAFACASLSNYIGSLTKLSLYINEAKKYNITILSPNINKSAKEFVYDKKGIYYSLLGINNLGMSIVDEILKVRGNDEFKSYNDFISRTKDVLNQKLVANLVYAGALDDFVIKDKITRKYMAEHYNEALQKVIYAQIMNFKMNDDTFTDEYTFIEMAEHEKEVLGFNLKYNIFIKYHDVKEKYHCQDFIALKENVLTDAIFIIRKQREIKTKQGALMAFLTLEDETELIDGVMFPEVYNKYKSIIESDTTYIGKVKLDTSREKKQIIILELAKL